MYYYYFFEFFIVKLNIIFSKKNDGMKLIGFIYGFDIEEVNKKFNLLLSSKI